MSLRKSSLLILTLYSVCFLAVGILQAQPIQREDTVTFIKRKLSGPRLGISYVAGNNKLSEKVADNDMGRTMSVFGWHFEQVVTPEYGGGPAFVVQVVPMVAAVEYGKFIPSVTAAMGVRFPGGFEVGMGPNLLLDRTSLAIAVGKTFSYSGVSVPLNLAYISSPYGKRIAFIIGYAISRL